MTRLCHTATFVLALGGALLLAAPADADLLNNGGFESDLGFDFSDPSNWNGFFGGPPGTFLEAFNTTGAPANSGNQALELTIGAGTDANTGAMADGSEAFTGHVQRIDGINVGDELSYSVFSRNNGSLLNGSVQVRLEFFGEDNTGAAFFISNAETQLQDVLTDTYLEFGVDATAPAGTAFVNAVLAIATGADPGIKDVSVLFDDASLTVAGIPEPMSVALLGLGVAGLLGARRRR